MINLIKKNNLNKYILILSIITILFIIYLFSTSSNTPTNNIKTIDTIDVTPLDREPLINVTNSTLVNTNFITGVDVSTIISLEESGVTFFNEDNIEQDIFRTLKENGVNYIRVRIWNDPYDSEGHSYGGGHNDLNTAKAIGTRATTYGMPLYVDFHYSDFWADPGKQSVPKSWSDFDFSQKLSAIYDYTYKSLEELIKEGIHIGIVQLGNETTSALCGETTWKNITALMNSASKAVRDISAEYNLDLLVALHFTNPEVVNHYEYIASQLNYYEVDYDVFASSYYPYWHSTLNNLYTVLNTIVERYEKQVLIAETAFPYTYADSDGFANIVNSYNYTNNQYDVSAQGQVDYLCDLIDTLAKLGDKCLGMFYWEPAWITVGASYSDNPRIWEQYGSGWASSYSSSYDPDDGGKYYGGSSWDNQALFDKNGHPLPSLSIFRYIKRVE